MAVQLISPSDNAISQEVDRVSINSSSPDDIYEAASLCRQRFDEYLRPGTYRLYTKQVAEFHRRFLSWAAFLGVFAPVSVCLDTRLATTPEMKELVTSMLAVLKRNLERGLKRHQVLASGEVVRAADADLSVENDGAMVGIKGSMDRLSRLALIIRAPSKPHDVDKVLQYSRRRNADGFDHVILALIKWRFPLEVMTESFQVQLAGSIIYRRNRLLYSFRHEAKLSSDRIDGADTETAPTELHGSAWQAALAEAQPNQAHPEPTGKAQQKHPSITPLVVAAGTSDLRRQVLIQHTTGIQATHGPQSDASSTRSNNPFISAEYPVPPTIPPGHSDGLCTICRKPQPRSVLEDKKNWRKHVDDDLKPYVCLSEQCGNLPPAFAVRADWRNHMRNKHRPDWAQYIHRPYRWICTLNHTPSLSFDTEQLLLDHLRTVHADEISDTQLTSIASRSKVPIPSEANICPLCGDKITLTSVTTAVEEEEKRTETPLGGHRQDALDIRLWKHMADHLESLALWSLRWWYDDSGASAETKGGSQLSSRALDQTMSQASSPIESPGPVATLKDRIANALEPSQFPRDGQGFLPAGRINDLVTEDTLLEYMPDLLNSENGKQLASFILDKAKLVFAILIDLLMDKQTGSWLLEEIISGLKQRQWDDRELPFHERHYFPLPTPSNRYEWSEREWIRFCEMQWQYLAPVFSRNFCSYVLDSNHILPFMWIGESPSDSEGSLVTRVHGIQIHEAHHEGNMSVVGLQEFSVMLTDISLSYRIKALDNLWERELEVLRIIEQLNHPHIAKPLATISIGARRLIMSEWADMGNLGDYWEHSHCPNLSVELIEQVIVQLAGLADGLCNLHYPKVTDNETQSHIRCGDLKPGNIVRFADRTELGTLKLTGLSSGMKIHHDVTELRDRGTKENEYRDAGSLYEAPEARTWSPFARSRLGDVWSIGCIILEFIIWLLYPKDDLAAFRTSLRSGSFYQIPAFPKTAQVHNTVVAWIDHMAKDIEFVGSVALLDLLRLVKHRLLVVSLPTRLGDPTEIKGTLGPTVDDQPPSNDHDSDGIPTIQIHAPTDDSDLGPGDTRTNSIGLLDELSRILQQGRSNRNYFLTDEKTTADQGYRGRLSSIAALTLSSRRDAEASRTETDSMVDIGEINRQHLPLFDDETASSLVRRRGVDFA